VGFLAERCRLESLTAKHSLALERFNCDHDDLNDFFRKDAKRYAEELLGKSYCFVLDDDPDNLVCAFTVSNDSIKVNHLPNSRKKKLNRPIPREKQFKSYPAVLIGRLGVSSEFKRCGIGRELMDFIKVWFASIDNKTGCRFVVVDSYNEEGPRLFYESNGFNYLFSSDAQEREYMGLEEDIDLKTRLMYFDLILLRS